MTETEINIAMSKYCAYHVQPCLVYPDYCHDLNAMHEAEKTLSEKQQVFYLQRLTQVRLADGVGGMIACMIDKTTFATARQRAEAFLRTLGKWKE